MKSRGVGVQTREGEGGERECQVMEEMINLLHNFADEHVENRFNLQIKVKQSVFRLDLGSGVYTNLFWNIPA